MVPYHACQSVVWNAISGVLYDIDHLEEHIRSAFSGVQHIAFVLTAVVDADGIQRR